MAAHLSIVQPVGRRRLSMLIDGFGGPSLKFEPGFSGLQSGTPPLSPSADKQRYTGQTSKPPLQIRRLFQSLRLKPLRPMQAPRVGQHLCPDVPAPRGASHGSAAGDNEHRRSMGMGNGKRSLRLRMT